MSTSVIKILKERGETSLFAHVEVEIRFLFRSSNPAQECAFRRSKGRFYFASRGQRRFEKSEMLCILNVFLVRARNTVVPAKLLFVQHKKEAICIFSLRQKASLNNSHVGRFQHQRSVRSLATCSPKFSSTPWNTMKTLWVSLRKRDSSPRHGRPLCLALLLWSLSTEQSTSASLRLCCFFASAQGKKSFRAPCTVINLEM